VGRGGGARGGEVAHPLQQLRDLKEKASAIRALADAVRSRSPSGCSTRPATSTGPSPPARPCPDEALAALDLFLGWHHHQFPVFHDGARQPSRWHIAGRTDRLERSLHDGAGIAIGLPLGRREAGGPTGATIVWARIAGASQYSRALKFKPLPTMVLQEGRSTRRLLIWALDTFRGVTPIDFGGGMIFPNSYGRDQPDGPDPCDECGGAAGRLGVGSRVPIASRAPHDDGVLRRVASRPPVAAPSLKDEAGSRCGAAWNAQRSRGIRLPRVHIYHGAASRSRRVYPLSTSG
jgi:hypothetical protein